MADTIKKWTESILPWLLDHGLKIVFIAVAAWLLNKILSRIIIRTVRVAIVANENMSKEGEKKREDTLIRIFNGALRIVILILAILMILQELGLKVVAYCRSRYCRSGSRIRWPVPDPGYYFRLVPYT